MKNRDKTIDILKGLAICLIVLGHTNFKHSNFLYLFHVAVFIIASGYIYKNNCKNTKDFLQLTKKKIIRLYIPYIVINIIFLLMNNIFIDLNIYSLEKHYCYQLSDFIIGMVKILLFRGVTEMAGATWFLHLLFIISIAYAANSYLITKHFGEENHKKFHLILSIIFLIAGFILTKLNINSFFDIYIISLNCYWLYYFGNRISQFKFNNKIICQFITIIISFITLVVLSNIGKIEISKNIYTDPLFFVICSISGWIMLYYFSIAFEKNLVGKIFSYLGQKSIYILMFHFVGFKIINIIIYLLTNKDVKVISSFPVAYGGAIYNITYFISGIFTSLLLYCLLNNTKRILFKMRRK